MREYKAFLTASRKLVADEDEGELNSVLMPGKALRIVTDSVIDRSSQSLRLSLEQNIKAALDAQRLPSLNAHEDTSAPCTTDGAAWTSHPSSSATWTSDGPKQALMLSTAQAQDDMDQQANTGGAGGATSVAMFDIGDSGIPSVTADWDCSNPQIGRAHV